MHPTPGYRPPMNVMYAQQGQQQYQRPPNQGQGNPNYPRQNSRGSLFD
jgi:hypothetical protein